MQISLRPKKKSSAVVGVDIDARSVAAAQVSEDGRAVHLGVQSLAPGAFRDGEVVNADAVADALQDLFSRHQLPKRVRLSIANQGVAFRTVRLPLIDDPEQLKAAVRFQAQEQIPMPLDSAVVDHQVIGGTVSEEGNRQIDVAVVAARRTSVMALMDVAGRAGLEPAGIDLAAFGMIRALAVPKVPGAGGEGEEFVQATLYCSLGDQTNLAIARDRACLFSRVAEFSVGKIAEGLSAKADLQIEHAEQWLIQAGLGTPLEEIEGDAALLAKARAELETGASRLADELRLSLDYYGGQDDATPVGGIAVCGWGSAVPGLPEKLAEELGRPVIARRPGALANLGGVEAGRLTLPYGVALEQ
jgi:type IV pilus assembly protein PilM